MEPWFGGADLAVAERVDSRWTLPVLSLVLCAITAGSMLANGTAADVWLGFALAAVLGGVPAYLVVGRLRGKPADHRWRPPARRTRPSTLVTTLD